MSAGIFLDDFERTENTDELHAILGRALVVATKFDSNCKSAALQIQLIEFASSGQINDLSLLLERLAEKYQGQTLSSSIKALKLREASVLLVDAKDARNAVAHDLAKGLTGCLDTRLNEEAFVKEVADLMFDIAHGDITISHILSALNDETPLRPEFIETYVQRVVQWVVER
jgi:hypothetical protein